MTNRFVSIALLISAAALSLTAQDRPIVSLNAASTPAIAHRAASLEGAASQTYHPYEVVVRSPDPGCAQRLGLRIPDEVLAYKRMGTTFTEDPLGRSMYQAAFETWETSTCGKIKLDYHGKNLRTTVGTNCQVYWMTGSGTSCNATMYLGLTNSALTPAMADTSIPSEIAANGLSRAAATVANTSGTLPVPSAPTGAVTGSTGTSYYYFGVLGGQGIDTTPSAASSAVSAASTLSATNYVTVTFTATPISPLPATCKVIRSNSSSAPSGSLAGGSANTSTGVVSTGTCSCVVTNSTTLTCTQVDSSLTVNAYTVPSSNLTYGGAYTLSHTWTATATQSAQAFGVFDASSSGHLIFEGPFTSTTLNTNDTLTVTETVNM